MNIHDTNSWLAAVTERDMDILLLEEIHVSEPFRAWLSNILYPDVDGIATFIGAWHSLREAKLGETDLLFAFQDYDGKTRACFIEDKIDASFTERQAERYIVRRNRLIASRKCDIAITCLVAPQKYIDTHSHDVGIFDRALSYEDIRDQIISLGGIRAMYRARFIQEAIDQNRRGYSPDIDVDVTSFWSAYYNLMLKVAPELMMKAPAGRPASSGFIYFVDCLPRGVKIVHKKRFDAVDLQVSNCDVTKLTMHVGKENLKEGMSFIQASKSAAIRIKVPAIDMNKAFESQTEAVKVALGAASCLLRFFEENANRIAPLVKSGLESSGCDE